MAIPGLAGGFIICQGHLFALKGHLCKQRVCQFVWEGGGSSYVFAVCSMTWMCQLCTLREELLLLFQCGRVKNVLGIQYKLESQPRGSLILDHVAKYALRVYAGPARAQCPRGPICPVHCPCLGLRQNTALFASGGGCLFGSLPWLQRGLGCKRQEVGQSFGPFSFHLLKWQLQLFKLFVLQVKWVSVFAFSAGWKWP